MFNIGHLHFDRTFSCVKPCTKLSETKKILESCHYIIIEADQYFVVDQSEILNMKELDDQITIDDWLHQMQWIASSITSMSDIFDPDLTWKRPVILFEEKQIKGIVTADCFIQYLLTENRHAHAYVSTMAETVNDAVTAVNRDGEVICWNSVAEQTYGINRESILGRRIGEHFKKESIMLHRILDEGRPVRQVYHQPTPETHVLINASPIYEKNYVIGGIATERDITHIVRLNEELYSSVPMRIEQESPFSSLTGIGQAMKQSLSIAQKIAIAEKAVLIIGEPGTGKEMLARAIHYTGNRKNNEFLSLNCSAIPSGLLEAELFGYQGATFTKNEHVGKSGKLEQADGGTLLLEEINQMPLELQIKFHHFLQSKTFCRVGSDTPIHVNTRIITTSSEDWHKLMQTGKIYEDLYYMLNVANIEIPPLRERTEDIPELVHSFLREYSLQYKKPIPKIEPTVMVTFMNYEWPGNIKELKNVMERLVLLIESDTVTLKLLPKNMHSYVKELPDEPSDDDTAEESILKTRLTSEKEAEIIGEALQKTNGNKSAAAKLLGISRGTLYNKLREYGLE